MFLILLGNERVNVLLDLSAVFDSVEHSILLSHLEHWVGIRGEALDWFCSYLPDRTFCVGMGDFKSSLLTFNCGVPQGSILGPLLFFFYLCPSGSILRQHRISFHCYTGDCHIYTPLKQNSPYSVLPLLECLDDVYVWMSSNFLTFNKNKTEVISFGPSSTSAAPSFNLGSLEPCLKSFVTDVGVIINSDFKSDKQVSAVVQKSFFK